MWGDFAFSLTLLAFGIVTGITLISKALQAGTQITVDIWLMGTVVLTFVVFGAQGLIRSVMRSRMGDGLKFSIQRKKSFGFGFRNLCSDITRFKLSN